MNNKCTRVNLFVLGAAKCGTTSLHHYLDQHLSIQMAHPKEPLFFEAEFELGYDYYLEKYFSGWTGQSILGEARHRNLYLPFVVPRIKAYASDDAKFLVILRNPVDRAYSHWWHNYSWGDEKRGFEEAVEVNLRRLENGPFFESHEEAVLYRETLNFRTGFSPYASYIDSGFYAEQIQRYIDAFGADRVKIMFLEDLLADPMAEMKKVFHFLGLSSNNELSFSIQNKANSKTGKKILRIIKNIPGKKILPSKFRSYLYQSIRNNFQRKAQTNTYSPALKRELISLYEPHIRELEILTMHDLSHWMSDDQPETL